MRHTDEGLDVLEVARVTVEQDDVAAAAAAGELEGEGLAGDNIEVGVEEPGLGHG